MSAWEAARGATDEWYTPKYIFDALGERFDLDPAHPVGVETNVPTMRRYWRDGLAWEWEGFVWLNPPFGGRNGIAPWLDKFFAHGNGIALAPDRTSAPWWQDAARKADAVLFVAGKVKFQRPDETTGSSPSTGTVLFGIGPRAVEALTRAHGNGLGLLLVKKVEK